MKCPFCGQQDSQVLESRTVDEGNALRRRRECTKCEKRFTTYERVFKRAVWVVKRDGKREPFDREKIIKGILRAIRKRPVSLELVEEIADSVEREILKKGIPEVSSVLIGKDILKRLKKVDKVAWLRFASVYLEFDNLEDFEKLIDKEI